METCSCQYGLLHGFFFCKSPNRQQRSTRISEPCGHDVGEEQPGQVFHGEVRVSERVGSEKKQTRVWSITSIKLISAEETRVFIILLQWEGVFGHHHRLYLATTRYTVWCQRNLCESEEVGQKKNQLQPGPLVWPQCLPLPTDMLSLSAYYHHTIWSLLWVAIHR